LLEEKWRKKYRPRKSDEWSQYSGPKGIAKSSSPLDIFKKLWPDYLNKSIIQQTLEREPNLEINDQLFDFYIASILVMGVVPQSHISHYWSRDKNGILGNKFIQKLGKFGFVRETFQKINAHLHINSKQLVDVLNKKFKAFYTSEEFLSVDEALVLFKGENFIFFCLKINFLKNFIFFFCFINYLFLQENGNIVNTLEVNHMLQV